MRTVALVPVTALAVAKTRLHESLSQRQRRELALWMAERVVRAAGESGAVAQVAVVSPDPEVLAWASAQGAVPIHQVSGGLNDGLELGRRWAQDVATEALLVLLGDLPRLIPREVAAIVGLADRPGPATVALAPDLRLRGTNGMLQRPADVLPFAFGPDSLARHTRLARARKIEPIRFSSPGIASDVDTPHDLRDILDHGFWLPTSDETPDRRGM